MRKRALLSCVTLLLSAATLSALDDIPRTASGKPDFSGNYDIRSLTPFQRSTERGDELVLSPEAAAKVEAGQVARVLKGDEPSQPDRPPPKKGAFRRLTELQLRLDGPWALDVQDRRQVSHLDPDQSDQWAHAAAD